MKKNRIAGFTLIELLMVIVIIGILSVYAIPRFMNISGDARRSTLSTLKADIETFIGSVNADAQVKGMHRKAFLAGFNSTTTGETIDLVYGYPAATLTGIGVYETEKTNAGQHMLGMVSGAGYFITFDTPPFNNINKACYVKYAPATGSGLVSAAMVIVADTGCD